MIQSDGARHNVAPRERGLYFNLVLSLQRFDGFDLDQGHMAAAAGIIGISAETGEIAIALQAAAGHGLHLVLTLHRRRASRRDVQ